MDRSSRVFSGTREATSSLPPRCSRKVRSLTLRTVTPGTARSASTISSECAASAAEQVTSTVSPSGRLSTTSMAVTAPPADPTAVGIWTLGLLLEPGAELAERRVEVRCRPVEEDGERAAAVLVHGDHRAAVVLPVEV